MVVHGLHLLITLKFGRPLEDPKVMLKLYLYGYLNKVHSSCCLEDEAMRNLKLI